MMFQGAEKTIQMFNELLDKHLLVATESVKLKQGQVNLLFADYLPDSDQRDALADMYRRGQCDSEVSLGVEELPMTAKKVLIRMKAEVDVKVSIRAQALAVQQRVKEKAEADAKAEALAVAEAEKEKLLAANKAATKAMMDGDHPPRAPLLVPGDANLPSLFGGALPNSPKQEGCLLNYPTPEGEDEEAQVNYAVDCADIFVRNVRSVSNTRFHACLRTKEEVSEHESLSNGQRMDVAMAGEEGQVAVLLDTSVDLSSVKIAVQMTRYYVGKNGEELEEEVLRGLENTVHNNLSLYAVHLRKYPHAYTTAAAEAAEAEAAEAAKAAAKAEEAAAKAAAEAAAAAASDRQNVKKKRE